MRVELIEADLCGYTNEFDAISF